MTASRKKVILRTADDELFAGYLSGGSLLSPDGTVELLDLSGKILAIRLERIRTVAFVIDFNLADRNDPEGLSRRTFLARPRSEGLWIRLSFHAGDVLEGIASPGMDLLDTLLTDHGLYLTPPDLRSNTQRLFIPRTAIASFAIVAVITSPSRVRPAAPAESRQETLFPKP